VKMRVAASVVIAGLIVLGASGCEFVSPQDTTQINNVADGMDANAGAIDIRDALLITKDGTTASLVTTLVNTSSAAVTVSMQYTSSTGPTTQTLSVPANGSVSVRPGGTATITLTDVKATLGSLFPVYFTAGASHVTVQIPVLNTALPGYQTLAPSPTPTPTYTPLSPTPDATSPAPSESATPAG